MLNDLTRKDILDGAIYLLTRKGFNGVTMEGVALKAGVAKGTLYLYFKNKDDLLEAAVDASFDPLIREIFELLDGEFSPDTKLVKFSLCHLRFFDENMELIRVLFQDREKLRSGKDRYTDRRYIKMVKKVAGVLNEGVRQDLFVTLDSMKVAAVFVKANMGMVMHRIHDGISGNAEKDAKLITDIFMYGLKIKNKGETDETH
jgi:AcrR family transcriptional regulator